MKVPNTQIITDTIETLMFHNFIWDQPAQQNPIACFLYSFSTYQIQSSGLFWDLFESYFGGF